MKANYLPFVGAATGYPTARWPYLLLLLVMLSAVGAQAQTTKTLPGNYSSFTQAINDINTNFPNGGVTVNVAAGYVETAPAGGLPLLTAQGTAGVGQIIFQKSGTGANPLITAAAGTLNPGSTTAAADALVRLSGTDYVTFDGIDLIDPASNNTPTTAMEYGFAFFRTSATNGCQNNTIRNCTVTLNRSGGNSTTGLVYGIYLATTDATGAGVTPTTAAGSNSGNRFYTNTILNTQLGIFANGFTAASPYTLADQNNDFGGASAATGNIIRNFGGVGSLTGYGIQLTAQSAVNASYNTVDNAGGGGVAAPNGVAGVYASLGQSGDCNLNNNQVTLTQAANASTGTATGVYAGHIGTGTANLLNNVVGYTTTAAATTGANTRMLVQSVSGSGIGVLNVSGNQLTYNLNNTGAGGLDKAAQGVSCGGTVTSAATISNNVVTFNVSNSGPGTIAASSNAHIGIATSVTTANLTISTNTVTYTLTNTDSGGTITASPQAIVNGGAVSGVLSISGNTIRYTVPAAPATVGVLSGNVQGVTNTTALPGSLVVSNNNYTVDITNSGATISPAMTGVVNQGAGISGTTSFNGNTFTFGLATSAGATTSGLTGIINLAPLTGAAAMSNNTLTYTGTHTGGTFTSSFTGVANSSTTASTLTFDNNTLLNSSTTSTGTVTIIQATGTSAGLLTISNNRYQNSSTASSGGVTFLNASSTSSNILVQGNQFTGFTKNATSGNVVYGYVNTGTPAGAGTHTLTSNTFTGLNLRGTAGTFTSPFVGLLAPTGPSTTLVVSNNTIGSLATGGGISTGSSTLTGLWAAGNAAAGASLTGNTIQNLSGAGAVVGISTSSSTSNPLTATSNLPGGSLSGNTVGSLSSSGVAGVYGMFLASSASATAPLLTSGNKISDLSATGAGTATVYGLYTALGSTHTLANNVVGNLTAPASTSSPAVAGLYLSAGTTLNVYYNTVYLSGSGGTNFGAAGIAFTGTPTTITLNNNLVQNSATASGTGKSVALGRVAAGTAGTPPVNLAGSSTSNLLYAASGLLYAEGLATATPTNAKTTLFTYRSFMYTAPGAGNSSLSREQRTISQPVSFVSTTGTDASFLQPTAAAPIEGGALPLADITTDYTGTTRSTTTPDIGAYEGSYTYLDLVAPGITYTPFSSRAFTNVLVQDVTPGSGVNGASGARPRVYYKLSTDPNAYTDNTSATPGWKWVEASGSTSPFSFTLDYSLLPTVPGQALPFSTLWWPRTGQPRPTWASTRVPSRPRRPAWRSAARPSPSEPRLAPPAAPSTSTHSRGCPRP
ncbi:beta strand repeat-containing protein [Hymenobacter sp. BRD67]|uniref:beta strand repeat-containing protein n=1 Tax=Hymenobacter sp. BRD67 TaxID=2675877 RepID=UPI0015662923|nr:hypothetical protein [Hymenobacter sp. BRD67]QKG53595.1 hypothetical protein GKZ67_14550 [Hymenobacter sp. BRD67]